MSIAKKIKSIIKGTAEKSTFGTDPKDPWSVRAGIAEGRESQLDQYLNSRGINPKFISKDTKISHAKSAEFLKWQKDHMFESMTIKHTPTELRQHALKKSTHMNKVVTSDIKPAGGLAPGLHEETDKEDVISFDIPLLIRMLEYAREDAKSDMDLHKVVEKLINIRSKGTLTMADYDFVTKLKEELQFDEAKTIQGTALDKFRQAAAEREKKHSEIEKKQSKSGEGMTSAIDRLQKHLNKEEVEQLDEISKSRLDSYRDMSRDSLKTAQINRDAAEAGKHMSKGFADLHAKSDAIAKKRVKGLMGYLQRKQGVKPMGEDIYQDGTAPTQTSFDGANAPDNTEPRTPGIKSAMSKSARIIKSLYKNMNMKEELYDSEKEDKSVATYGKKPKMQTIKVDLNKADTQPKAAAVLSGGKTLTGQTRDTLEIDPEMKRPTRPDGKKEEQK